MKKNSYILMCAFACAGFLHFSGSDNENYLLYEAEEMQGDGLIVSEHFSSAAYHFSSAAYNVFTTRSFTGCKNIL